MEIPGAAAGQLRTYHERPRYLRLDRPYHPRRLHGRRVLHRRLAAGSYRQNPRPSMGGRSDGRRLDNTDLRLCAVAGRADLGLCRHSRAAMRRHGHDHRHHGRLSRRCCLRSCSSASCASICSGRLRRSSCCCSCNIGLFIPMGWGAPQGTALVARNSVAIVPSVAGEVTEVPVLPNTPLKAGDILFRIDPVPYEAQVKAIEAQLKLSELRLSQMTQLYERDSGRAFDVQQRQSEVDQLKGQLEAAQWNLDKTVVHAPADGYVTNLALRKGARVANLPLAPVMAFIDTSDTILGWRSRRSMRATSRRGSRSRSLSSSCPAGLHRAGRDRAAGDRDGQTQHRAAVAPKDVQSGRSSCASSSMMPRLRGGCRPARPARRRSTPSTSGRACDPQGAAAADRDPELRQPVLMTFLGHLAWVPGV